MSVIFDTANSNDISELIRLRIAYITDDYGSISEDDQHAMEEQLPGYFERKLGKDFIAFVARADGQLVATAYLLIIEKPANPSMQNGLVGEVLSVFTEKRYRGQGISTRLMNDLVKFLSEVSYSEQIKRADFAITYICSECDSSRLYQIAT